MTFDKYCQGFTKLLNRLVEDQEFINQHISTMDKNLVGNNDNTLNAFLLDKLSEVRELLSDLKKYNGRKFMNLWLGEINIFYMKI